METITPGRPYLLVQADIDATQREAFERWHDEVHVAHVLEIPGVTGYRRFRSSEGRHIALYEFEDEACINEALRSKQASLARREWAPWLRYAANLSVEVYTVLCPSVAKLCRN